MDDKLLRSFREVERLFDEVLDLDPEARQARLSAPDLDPQIRSRLEDLLRADAAAATFLETPPPLDGIALPADAPLPERVGPYRIVGVLGHGGMGTVLAGLRDEAGFVQRVAIKRLHAGAWSRAARERFLREREILAGLEHPNVARLVDGGVDAAGLPYFAMEQVEGAPITEHARAARLELPARLALFEQICHAVEYAHARLVVHRDLKPANVLVTPSGQAKLLDFGIAKLLEQAPDDPALTATAASMMTPAYAAPEQFQGQPITVATDVYQLGVLLYELLTERSPHGSAGSPLALQRRVVETEPERPSRAATAPARARQLAGDLDAIVMKALRKDPAERYPSVEALRRDIEAYRESRPVGARRGTGIYRLRKYVHRHRVAAAASAMLVLSLSGGLVGVGVQARIAEQERDRARSAESRAEAIRAFLLDDLLKAPAPESSLGRPLTVAEVLDAASRSVGHAFRDIPGTEADVRLTLARTYASLGRTEDAQRHAEQARRLLEQAYGAESTHALRARALLADLLADAGRYADARAEIESVLAEQLGRLAPADPDVLASRLVLGRVLTLESQFFAAEAELRDALTIQERERPDDWRLAVGLRGALVDALIGRVVPPETEALCREILEIQERHLGPEHPEIAATLDRLSGVLQRKLRYEDALAIAERALELRRRVQGEGHPLTADAWSRVAIQHDRLHHTGAALEAARHAHSIYEASLGPEHPQTLEALHRVAIELRLAQRLDEAEPMYRRVIAGLERRLGEEHPSTLRALSHLETLLAADGRVPEAREVHARLCAISERIVARPDADAETIDDYLYYLLTVDPPELRDPWRALALAERIVGETQRQVPHMLLSLGIAQRDTGRPDLAIDTLREALALPEGVRSWTAMQTVVELLNEQGREAEVVPLLVDLRERQLGARGEEDFVVAATERQLALQHERLGQPAEAERWFRASLERLRSFRPDEDWEVARAKSELGGCLLDRGAVEEAAPLVREGLRTLEGDPRLQPRWIEEARARAARLR